MNLKQLKYFVKTAETGNLSHAAHALNIAQTALGLQIKNLEDELGVPLINRHSRGVSLTEAGEIFAGRAREILTMLDDTVSDLRDLGSGRRPLISLGMTPSVMELLGPRVFELAEEISDVASVKFVEGLSFKLVSALENHEIDCAFAFNIEDNPQADRYALLEETLFFVSAPDPDLNWQPIAFEDALVPNLALLSRRDIIWQIVHNTADYLSREVTVAFEVQSQSAVKKLVEQGAATSIIPYGAMVEEATNNLICARPIANARAVRTLYFTMSRSARKTIPPAFMKVFVPALLKEYSQRLGAYAHPLRHRLHELR
ncbi:LysR family transcriptional regulator [Sinisalibacter aestuarii]|uniref:LysR family transcriptional regulator n=1 Tax=Sinisalibacter aestuarii TaxID=2949426 RepID=A0ABQ5LYR1_9RHOB|nr:LysR family transcriptional regulator [Sinisalibacter aestuarii]GKY90109.1 LysR family transcriptional regulator [Sinisalibacter aestuarii]